MYVGLNVEFAMYYDACLKHVTLQLKGYAFSMQNYTIKGGMFAVL